MKHIFLFRTATSRSLVLATILLLSSLIFSACGEQSKSYDLGIYLEGSFASVKSDGLKVGLKALGYNEGTSISYHILDSQELKSEQLLVSLKELADKSYPVYWTTSSFGATQLKQAGVKAPIIVAGLNNPVQSGQIKSYTRTGTNLNGVDSLSTELTVNRLNLLLTFDPNIRKVYLLYDANQADSAYLGTLREEASRLGVTLYEKGITSAQNSRDILESLKASEAPAILTIGSNVMENRVIDIELLKTVITKEKLLLVGADQYDLSYGALFSYGASYTSLGRQSAAYVDRVLHGVDVTQLPLLQPNQLELILNQKAADILGRKFSDQEKATADQVIN